MTTALLTVGLTGGIATGKSYCLERFARFGAATIDADEIAHDALAIGRPGLDAVIARFGRGVLQPDGHLDRAALGRIVFADADARRDLEAIVHPEVYLHITQWLAAVDDLHTVATAQLGPVPGIAIADIPLLFETGRQYGFDAVLVVACTPDRQLQRLLARGLSTTDAEQRIAAQWPIEEKIRRADYVIDTSGTFSDTDAQLEIVWKKLSERAVLQP
ncbi:MAG TPA: dephospho-CoA kinase [Vicinamibacterales bacterium]